MQGFEVVAILLLFGCAMARNLIMRPAAIHFPGKATPAFSGIWMLLASFCLLPFYYPLLLEALPSIQTNPAIVLVSFAKGLFLWGSITLTQIIRRHSSSSAAFRSLLTVGLLAIFNAGLGEVLNFWQWSSVIVLSILGAAFLLHGHLKQLPQQAKYLFTILVFISALPGMTDQIVITQTNWYVQFILSTISLCIISAVINRDLSVFKKAFSHKVCFMAGATWGVTEVIILMLLVTYVPVTVGAAAMAMSVPTVMLISSLRWKEGRWWEQALFGSTAYVAAIPLFIL